MGVFLRFEERVRRISKSVSYNFEIRLSTIVKLTPEAGFEGEPIRPAESGIRLSEGIRERYIEQHKSVSLETEHGH